jgi:glycosyltransferase involved in cell wall biosynthesis
MAGGCCVYLYLQKYTHLSMGMLYLYHMIIGIDASRLSENKRTGVEWYAFFVIEKLKKLLVNKDITVRLYCREPLKKDVLDIMPDNWEVVTLSWPPKRLWTQIRLSWEMWRQAPDVLFIPAHVPPLIHPKKTVVMIHDIAAKTYPESYNFFERWYSLWSAKYTLEKMSDVLSPSDFTKKQLEKLLPTDDIFAQIHVIPHGYDTKFGDVIEEKKQETILDTYHIKKPYILSVSRLEEKKNTLSIISAFERYKERTGDKDLSLVLVGKAGYGYEKVKEAMDTSTYKKDIYELGWIEQGDLPAIMQGAQVFLFPSLYEGFGLPVLEAMAAGVPVICSRGLSFEDIAGHAAFYVDPTDVGQMVDNLYILLRNKEERKRVIKEGKMQAMKFSWESTAKKTAEVLLDNPLP